MHNTSLQTGEQAQKVSRVFSSGSRPKKFPAFSRPVRFQALVGRARVRGCASNHSPAIATTCTGACSIARCDLIVHTPVYDIRRSVAAVASHLQRKTKKKKENFHRHKGEGMH